VNSGAPKALSIPAPLVEYGIRLYLDLIERYCRNFIVLVDIFSLEYPLGCVENPITINETSGDIIVICDEDDDECESESHGLSSLNIMTAISQQYTSVMGKIVLIHLPFDST
jgi:hypothetical protein